MTKTWIYTGVLFAIALLTALLMQGVAQSINQPGDLGIAVDSERYEEGDAVNFDLRLTFAKGEVATTTSVRLTVDGPQSFSALLPLKEGAHDLDDLPGLIGSLKADVHMSGVIDLSSASSTPTSIISVVLKGITQGASIDISAQWLPDESVGSVGDYTAQLIVQLTSQDGVLVSPEIKFSIDAALDSTPTPKPTATPVNVIFGPTRAPTRTPAPTPVPTATPTAVATVTPLSKVVVTENAPTSISQTDMRTAVVDALAPESSLRRDAAASATANQPSETPTRSTTIASNKGVSTSVAVRQSRRALPAKRTTPTPTHTSTTIPTTTPLAFVRVSSLRRFSVTPARPAPAPTVEPAPTTQAGESGIGAAGFMAVAVMIIAINAVLIGLLTRLLPKFLP
ncbi:MAG: hypothetical protein IIC83_11675 [Chloroflexi bacterium]|nr:hypothetical protein [Chloroflexota bacterium]